MKDFNIVLNQFNTELGVNMFEETRRRSNVEARACFYHYLYKYKGCGLVEITRLVEGYTGRKPNHATVHHAIEMYEVYSGYNPKLNEALLSVVGYFNTSKDKQQYIKNTITRLPDEIIDDIHNKVMTEYTKILVEESFKDVKNLN